MYFGGVYTLEECTQTYIQTEKKYLGIPLSNQMKNSILIVNV